MTTKRMCLSSPQHKWSNVRSLWQGLQRWIWKKSRRKHLWPSKERLFHDWKNGCRNVAAQRRLKKVVTEEREIEKVAVKEKWGESSEDVWGGGKLGSSQKTMTLKSNLFMRHSGSFSSTQAGFQQAGAENATFYYFFFPFFFPFMSCSGTCKRAVPSENQVISEMVRL